MFAVYLSTATAYRYCEVQKYTSLIECAEKHPHLLLFLSVFLLISGISLSRFLNRRAHKFYSIHDDPDRVSIALLIMRLLQLSKTALLLASARVADDLADSSQFLMGYFAISILTDCIPQATLKPPVSIRLELSKARSQNLYLSGSMYLLVALLFFCTVLSATFHLIYPATVASRRYSLSYMGNSDPSQTLELTSLLLLAIIDLIILAIIYLVLKRSTEAPE